MAPPGQEALVCPPTYYFDEITPQDSINPWMKPGTKVDHALLMEQWQHLVDTMRSIGVIVHEIEPDPELRDMVFATDSALIVGNQAVIARFLPEQRRAEAAIYREWLADQGYDIVDLPKDDEHFFEAGDAAIYNDTLVLGTGFRSSKATGDAIGEALGLAVVTTELVNPWFYHQDTAFLAAGSTIHYHPPAFSEKSKADLARLAAEAEGELRPIDPREAQKLALNSLLFGMNVILQTGNPDFSNSLSQNGYAVHALDLSELHKSGGGAHCAVQRNETMHNLVPRGPLVEAAAEL